MYLLSVRQVLAAGKSVGTGDTGAVTGVTTVLQVLTWETRTIQTIQVSVTRLEK